MVMSVLIFSAIIAAPIGFIIALISSRISLENVNSFKLIGLENAKVEHEAIVLNETMDLKVLSSFNCSATMPLVLHEYIDSTFVEEQNKVISAMASHPIYKDDLKALPALQWTETSCSVDKPCSSVFQYDKPYSLAFDIENTVDKTAIFYCCDPKTKYDFVYEPNSEQANVCNITETLLVNKKYSNNSLLWA